MNHQNKTVGANSLSLSLSLSLVRDSLKVFKTSSFVFIAAALVVGGFFAPQQAFAAANVTPADLGTNVSIDTTSLGGSGLFTTLDGPGITETVAGDIVTGTHTVTLPSGWEFDTSSSISIVKIGNIVLGGTSITPTQTAFSFVVNTPSTSASVLIFSGLKVRPTTTAPSTGIMTYSSASITGVTGSTNFGTLSTVAGTVTQLAFTTQPGATTVYGSNLSTQPVIKTQDQFGNDSTNGLATNLDVTLAITSGEGALQGTTMIDIGANSGTATYSDLYVDTVGSGKQLTASATDLDSATSDLFEVTAKPLTATVTANDKTYDGDNTAVVTATDISSGLVYGDSVTADIGTSATFSDENAGLGKTVTATGITLNGAKATNYSFDGTGTGTANINQLGITVTPTVGQTKVYGSADPVFTYDFTPALISPDTFTGTLSRVVGEDVNTYAYTLGDLSAGPNYSLNLAADTFAITQKTLTVTATGVNREYDQTTNATVTLSSADEVGGDSLVYAYTSASFLTKTAENGKTVNVSGISISGTKMGNYALQSTEAVANANITKKSITATLNLNNKVYDGDTSAAFSPGVHIVLNNLIGDDVVVTNEGSKAFLDKHVSTGKTVNANGIILDGADAGNYAFDGTGTGTATINARPITVTAATNSKIYDGTTSSVATPTITVGTLQTGDALNFSQTYDTKNIGENKVLTPSGVVIDGNPTLEGSNYIVTLDPVSTGEITTKSINVTAVTDTKTYDGTTSSSVVPVVDALETIDTVGTPPTQVYDTKNVGTTKTLTPGGLVINDGNSGLNYTIVPVVNNTGVINAKGLTVSGATTNSKIYNGDATATVNFGLATLVGKIAGEEALVTLNSSGYSAAFNNKNVATGKTVTVSGLELAGDGASNYSLTQPILNDGVITERTLVVTADGTTKVYDGNDDATAIVTLGDNRVPLDEITLGHTATFDGPNGKDVGDGKDVSVTGISITGDADAGNYTLNDVTTAPASANITPATLTATVTIADKIYDGNNTAEITGYTPVDKIGSDEVILSGGTATFNNKNVIEGNNAVSATGISKNGADAGNYTYNGTATGAANITALGITGSFAASNKTYDGNTSANVLTRTLNGVLSGDELNVSLTGGSATFAGENVADGITVTASGMTLSGSAEGNYELLSVGTTIANITKAPLTITADNKSKEYGDVNPTLTASYSGFVGIENESVLDTPVVLETTADMASSVGDYPITASGASDNNYEITHGDGTLTVNKAPINITPDSGQGKIYGESDEEVTYEASGFKNGQDKSLFTGALGREEGEDAGDYLIDEGDLDVGGNYLVDSFFDVFYTIEQRELTVTAVTDTKTYNGTTDSVEIPTIVGDLQFGQTPNFTQSYDTAGVGNDKILTADGVVNDGNDGDNYTYNFSNTAVGEITELEITVTPDAGQSKVYGQDDTTFTYTNTPDLIGVDEFTGALSREAGTNVGTYNYELGSLTAGGNYLLTLGGTETFEIIKATPVITWESPANIVYGTALSGTELNATSDVGGAFVYTPVSGTVLNAGAGQTLSVVFTPTDTANYNNAEETVLITVTPAPLTVTADDKSKEYSVSDPALTYEFSGLVNDDTNAVFSGALARIAGEAVGTYDINQGTLLAGSNYNITYVVGTLTIADTVAPTLISHTPSFNALNISPTTAIVVTFSEPVDVESGDVSFSPTISGGFTISNSGTSVVTITPNNPLADNTTYTITLAGVADINGLSLPTYGNIKFTTATNYSINLNANASGWNLISLPVVPSNTAIATVLGSAADNIDAVWTYDPTNPNAVNGWLVFVPGNPEGTNNLTLMTTGFGYWVSVTDNANLSGAGTLLIAGPTSPPSRSLQTGWNLVGYYQLPNETESTPTNAFASIGAPGVGYNGLWGFDNTTGSFNSVTTINPGDAFWISLPSVKTYTPSNIE